MLNFLSDLYQFSRPHTIPATMMAIIYQFASVGGFSTINFTTFVTLITSLVKWELVVLYIVGINQIYDIEIDRINKQYLPLASGGFDLYTAEAITYGAMIISILLGMYQKDMFSFIMLVVCLIIGTLYSVPAYRFKQSKILAAGSIILARGVLVNLAEYSIFHRGVHPQETNMRSLSIIHMYSIDIAMCMCHASLFTTAVSIAKDLPDMEGDRQHKIQTFALRYGWWLVGAATVALVSAAVIVPMMLVLFLKPFQGQLMAFVYILLAITIMLWLTSQLRALKRTPNATALSAWYHGSIWPVFYLNFAILTSLQMMRN